MSTDLQTLIKDTRKLIKQLRDRKPPKLQPLPPDLAALFCTVCDEMTPSRGCPKHPVLL